MAVLTHPIPGGRHAFVEWGVAGRCRPGARSRANATQKLLLLRAGVVGQKLLVLVARIDGAAA